MKPAVLLQTTNHNEFVKVHKSTALTADAKSNKHARSDVKILKY